MIATLIVVLAIILLTGLLYFESKQKTKGVVPAKALLSSLFVIAALLQPHAVLRYYHCLLAGLLLCLVGDVFLAIPGRKTFLGGLIAFLLGHVAYTLGFWHISRAGVLTWVGFLIIVMITGKVFLWLKPQLKSMTIPVLCYCIVIAVMLSAAWSVWADSGRAQPGRTMVFIGAFLFYISDIFVARNRFLRQEFFNRLLGLPLYYTGQFMLAFSVGWLR
jgi:uncharacterized membrane protein YhhN